MNDGSDQKRVRKQIRMFVQWKVDGRKRKKMKKNKRVEKETYRKTWERRVGGGG